MFWSAFGSIAFFGALLAGLWIGCTIAQRAKSDEPGGSTAAADGIVFAVLGLLLAFTFTAAASRFDERRKLVVQHANALGTAHLRLDLLEPADRAPIRARMMQWIDSSLKIAHLNAHPDQQRAAMQEADRLQNEVWSLALAGIEKRRQPPLTPFVMSPINDWIDLSTTRISMNRMGAPLLVVLTLIALSLLASVLAGFSMSRCARRRPLQLITFAAVIAFSFYVILDLSNPRAGLITIEAIDEPMIQLRQSIQKAPQAP